MKRINLNKDESQNINETGLRTNEAKIKSFLQFRRRSQPKLTANLIIDAYRDGSGMEGVKDLIDRPWNSKLLTAINFGS